jgi:hypothetical protein
MATLAGLLTRAVQTAARYHFGPQASSLLVFLRLPFILCVALVALLALPGSNVGAGVVTTGATVGASNSVIVGKDEGRVWEPQDRTLVEEERDHSSW